MSNFTFLESFWAGQVKMGDLSEKYVYSAPNTSIIKQSMLADVWNEVLTFEFDGT